MTDFRLFMWMLFGVSVGAMALIAFGYPEAGGWILGGVTALTFCAMVGRFIE